MNRAPPRHWRHGIRLLLILAAGVAAYSTSFSGAFIFDDQSRIMENARIRQPWPVWPLLSSPRPLVELSLAFNYALSGFAAWSYHLFNLSVHLAAALLLFGLGRRTLLTARLRPAYGQSAPWLALAVALLWAVHPLQTQSVTYVIQRAESLMGLWYLLTLYAVLRGATSPTPRRWDAAAVLACALGMATKPIMVTAPLTVLLYDRVFLAGSFRQALRARRGLYLGLMGTWIILALLLTRTEAARMSAGFNIPVTPLQYAATQPGVILHYLRLALLPHPLVFDYEWPVATTLQAILWPALGLGALVAGTLWAWRRAPALGFLGAWVFLLLAPTSSVIPVRDLAVEHRMYLPLAAVITLLVIGGEALLRRALHATPAIRRGIGATLVLLMAAGWGGLTIRRNGAYRSPAAIWADTVRKRPRNARAHTNFGNALFRQGELEPAMQHYAEALRLAPPPQIAADAGYNLGRAHAEQGRLDAAIRHYREALRINPAFAEAHNNLAAALLEQGRLDEAMRHYREALRVWPAYPEAHVGLGALLTQQGKLDDAVTHYQEALRANPDSAEAHNNLGVVLEEQGKIEEAMAHYREALRLNPDYAKARKNLEGAQRATR